MGRTGERKEGGKGKTTTARRKWERERRWKLRKQMLGNPTDYYLFTVANIAREIPTVSNHQNPTD